MGLIFDIKRYAIHDGPGIRVTVFLKGCPLACKWCHNPESISSKREKMYTASTCIGCGECVRACPVKAVSITKEGVKTDLEKCRLCGDCVEICPTKSLEIVGEEKSVEEIMAIAEKERLLIEESNGGITFSGGEPLMQPEFLIDLLKASKQHGFHRTVDTSGFAPEKTLLTVAQDTDLFLFDLKHIDNEMHKKFTGVSNKIILSNLQKLAEIGAEIEIRIPVIGGINTDAATMGKMADFISSLAGNKKKVTLLPYHNIAVMKNNKLGKTPPLLNAEEPNQELLANIKDIFKSYGLEASA